MVRLAVWHDYTGVIAVVIGILLCFLLRDRPRSMGLPTVGEWRNDVAEINHEEQGVGLSRWNILKDYIFKIILFGYWQYHTRLFMLFVQESTTGEICI
ncbi:hypothetical protein [Escherichia coli]|uniref:hypothetical protein n=1 Tax=Escherichia coli TaxID=562 RepID=UPI002359C26E|nr:hypothetical protein [Escherichia coli]MDC9037922.1 hypothetical protein [Escherichia coli]